MADASLNQRDLQATRNYETRKGYAQQTCTPVIAAPSNEEANRFRPPALAYLRRHLDRDRTHSRRQGCRRPGGFPGEPADFTSAAAATAADRSFRAPAAADTAL